MSPFAGLIKVENQWEPNFFIKENCKNSPKIMDIL